MFRYAYMLPLNMTLLNVISMLFLYRLPFLNREDKKTKVKELCAKFHKVLLFFQSSSTPFAHASPRAVLRGVGRIRTPHAFWFFFAIEKEHIISSKLLERRQHSANSCRRPQAHQPQSQHNNISSHHRIQNYFYQL